MSAPDASPEAPAARYVHYCPFCDYRRATDSPTILTAGCPECGCTISSCREPEFPQLARECEEQPFIPVARRDGSALLAAIIMGLLLLPRRYHRGAGRERDPSLSPVSRPPSEIHLMISKRCDACVSCARALWR